MNARISVFAICVEAIIYLLLYNLPDCSFKSIMFIRKTLCANVKSNNGCIPLNSYETSIS